MLMYMYNNTISVQTTEKRWPSCLGVG